MGLIQDLQGRKLTGCSRCDKIRKRLYRGMDLMTPSSRIQAATTHDSFDASALGAFIESTEGARGFSSAITIGDMAILEFRHLTGQFLVRIWSHGDFTGDMADTEVKIYDGDDNLYVTVSTLQENTSFNNPIVTANGLCNAVHNETLTPLGWTRSVWREITGTPSDLGDEGDVSRVEVINTLTSEVVKEYDGFSFCLRTTFGSTEWDNYYPIAPPCWSDEITGSTGSKAIFRWTKVEVADGEWAIRPHVSVDNNLGVPLTGTLNWYYTDSDFLSIFDSTTPIPSGTLQHCSGGTWSSTFARTTSPTGLGNMPAGVEPIALVKVVGTTSEEFDLDGLLPIQEYANFV